MLPFAKALHTLRDSMAKVALGKGLGALIKTHVVSPTPAVENGERVQLTPLSEIIASPLQPRTHFTETAIDELVESIRQHGIIQPLIVRRRGNRLELIAGERRWRAAMRLGLAEAPVIVREASDQDVLELALIENLQREDLNAIEEARAFARLAREFGLRQDDIAQKVGKSRAAVANSMRLLDLAEQVQSWLTQERISVGHAKVLLSLKSHEEQALIADEIIRRALTVRAAEQLIVRHFASNGVPKPTRGQNSSSPPAVAPAVLHVQNRLQRHFATHVAVHHAEKRGRIEIDYYGNDDLQRILEMLGLPSEDA